MNQNKEAVSLTFSPDLKALTAGQILRVSPQDEKACRSLLRGDFSTEWCARTVPQMKMESGSRQSYVFEIIPDPGWSGPHKFLVALKTLKRQDFILLFFPLLLVLFQNLKMDLLPKLSNLLLCFVGLISLVLSLRFRNEYVDHLRGTDRWNPEFARSPLFQGHLRAFEINRWAFVFLGLAFLSLLGLLFSNPYIALIAVPAGLLAFYTQYFHLSTFKERPYGEVLVFALFGPLFLSGLELSLFQRVQFWNFVDGFIVGLTSMFLLNLKVFSNFLYLAQVHSQNTLIRFGFDRSKEYLFFSHSLILILFCIYQFFVFRNELGGSFILFGLAAMSVILSIRFWLVYKLCQSSAGSAVKWIQGRGTESIYFIYLTWLGLQLWLVFAIGR